MKILFYLFCCVLLSGNLSCKECSSKKITCGAFNDPTFFKWFPYQPGFSGYYKNIVTQDTTGFSILNIDTSKSYETTVGGFGRPNSGNCSAYANIYGYFYDSSAAVNIYYDVIKGINDSYTTKKTSIYFKNSYWTAGIVTEEILSTDTLNNITTVANTQNVLFENGTTYAKLVTLTNDTTIKKDSGMVYKLFIAKGFGIVGFETYPLKQKWVLQ